MRMMYKVGWATVLLFAQYSYGWIFEPGAYEGIGYQYYPERGLLCKASIKISVDTPMPDGTLKYQVIADRPADGRCHAYYSWGDFLVEPTAQAGKYNITVNDRPFPNESSCVQSDCSLRVDYGGGKYSAEHSRPMDGLIVMDGQNSWKVYWHYEVKRAETNAAFSAPPELHQREKSLRSLENFR